jgi:hypothetical protein
VGAAFWLTVEDGVWIAPALLVVILVSLLRIYRPFRISTPAEGRLPERNAQLKAVALPFGVALAAFVGAILPVAGLNYRHYGVFETSELRSASFLRAYGALTRIRHDEWDRYVPFPKDARERAYAGSPTAKELGRWFEGPYAWQIRRDSCAAMKVSPCPEVLSDSFLWELRGAVQAAGHNQSAPEAKRFYSTLADQIDSACDQHTIDCLPRRSTLMPPFRTEYLGETLYSSKAVAKTVFTLRDGPAGSHPSNGSLEGISYFSHLVGGVYPPNQFASSRVIQGWVAANSGTPTVRLVSHTAQKYLSTTAVQPAPDVEAAYPNVKAVRFNLQTNCPEADCDLVVQAPGGNNARIPLAKLVSRASFAAPSMRLMIDDISNSVDSAKDATNPRWARRVKIADAVGLMCAASLPILAGLGGMGLLLSIFFITQGAVPDEILALGLASVVAVITRILYVAYLNATVFPAANLLYASAASPFVIVFAVTGIYAGCAVLLRANRPLIRIGKIGAYQEGRAASSPAQLEKV